MSIFEDANTLKLLQDLLQPPDESSDSEEEHLPAAGIHKFGPGDILSKKTATKTVEINEKAKEVEKKYDGPRTIEEWQQQQELEDADTLETRKYPDYKVIYKQSVSASDVYLQMGNKTGATSSCENMIIDVFLPEETVGIENMDLKVKETEIDLRTPVYRLKLPLMQNIDPDQGKANYDPDKKTLTLTLVMKREYDYVNF